MINADAVEQLEESAENDITPTGQPQDGRPMRGSSFPVRVRAQLSSLFVRAEDWAFDSKKALYGFAIVRIISGVTILGFLATNFSTRYYSYGSGSAWSAEGVIPVSAFSTMPIFDIVHRFAYNDLAFSALYGLLAVLAVLLIVGYRFRLVLPALFVLWVGLLEQTSLFGDMSDNLSRIVLFFLFFTGAADVWSLDARRRRRWAHGGSSAWFMRVVRNQPVLPPWIPNLVHNAALAMLIYQICLVYFTGGFYKLAGESWREGIAVWYPLQVSVFSTFPEITGPLLNWGPLVAAATLGTVLVQIWFPWMLLNRWSRILALVVIMVFHVAIGILMGLFWFSLWMVALDAVLIRDVSYQRLARWVSHAVRRTPRREPKDQQPGPRRTGLEEPTTPPKVTDQARRAAEEPSFAPLHHA
ncbi:HTTM domain-containing protein [Microbacterium sp. NPDC076911]|uniref:HTTM domain-containing protein n=1 Tax=Microbacterium sp. NPDC076911 TaxID=3154958 RepID=UPI0034247C4C